MWCRSPCVRDDLAQLLQTQCPLDQESALRDHRPSLNPTALTLEHPLPPPAAGKGSWVVGQLDPTRAQPGKSPVLNALVQRWAMPPFQLSFLVPGQALCSQAGWGWASNLSVTVGGCARLLGREGPAGTTGQLQHGGSLPSVGQPGVLHAAESRGGTAALDTPPVSRAPPALCGLCRVRDPPDGGVPETSTRHLLWGCLMGVSSSI